MKKGFILSGMEQRVAIKVEKTVEMLNLRCNYSARKKSGVSQIQITEVELAGSKPGSSECFLSCSENYIEMNKSCVKCTNGRVIKGKCLPIQECKQEDFIEHRGDCTEGNRVVEFKSDKNCSNMPENTVTPCSGIKTEDCEDFPYLKLENIEKYPELASDRENIRFGVDFLEISSNGQVTFKDLIEWNDSTISFDLSLNPGSTVFVQVGAIIIGMNLNRINSKNIFNQNKCRFAA